MIKKIGRDLVIILSSIWINLLLFLILMISCTLLLKFFGAHPQAGWPQLLMDSLHLATIERIDTGGKFVPILLAFIMPVGLTLILGEGILRVLSIYLQRRVNRKEWDLMVVKKFKDHAVVCGVGEMGRHLLQKLIVEQPDLDLVLIDPHPSVIAEASLKDDQAIHLQGDMADVEILNQANIQTARLVILTAGEDTLNLETAYKVMKINSSIPIWIRLHRSGLSNLLDLASKPQIHFFCPYQQAADTIIDQIMERKTP
ncbi:NAD-binding protein [Chloroflexota bacterium]